MSVNRMGPDGLAGATLSAAGPGEEWDGAGTATEDEGLFWEGFSEVLLQADTRDASATQIHALKT